MINAVKNTTNQMSSVRKLTLSGVVIALYVCIMFFTQSFAFGQYQIRIATSIYSLSAIYPFLIVPLGLANFLSNTIMGGLGPLDMVGGAIVGIITAGSIYLIKKFNFKMDSTFFLCCLLITIVNTSSQAK